MTCNNFICESNEIAPYNFFTDKLKLFSLHYSVNIAFYTLFINKREGVLE